MSLTPNNTGWIDSLDEPKPKTSSVTMQTRVRFNDFYRIDAGFTIGHAQLYHFINDTRGTHRDPCYVLAALSLNADAIDEEHREYGNADDLWLVSAAGLGLSQAIMRILHGVDRVPLHDDSPTNAQAALLRMRGTWQNGQLSEMVELYALGAQKKRIVCYLDRGHDFFEPELLFAGFDLYNAEGERVYYIKELE